MTRADHQLACGCSPVCACPRAESAKDGSAGERGKPLSNKILSLQRTAGNRAVSRLLAPQVHREVDVEPEPLPDGPFPGRDHVTTVRGRAFSFRGRTVATYSHSWDHTNDQVNGNQRTGDLVENYTVATNVTLPPIPAGLSECEQPIVADAIDNQLAAHEQDHVTAFEGYNGSTNTPYTVRGGPQAATAALGRQHSAHEAARRAAVDQASKALDPFVVAVNTTSCDPPAP